MQRNRQDRIERIRRLKEQSQALRQQKRPVPQPVVVQPIIEPLPPKPVPRTKLSPPEKVSGLANLGNSCYMNSVLECFRHCGPLIRYLFGPGFQRDRVCFINRKPIEQAFVGEFRNLLRDLEATPQEFVRPASVLKLLVLFNPSFSGFRQADAQECINTILEVLHTGLTVNINIINNPGVGASDVVELQRSGNNRYAQHFKQNGYSVIEEVFGSQFLSKLSCQNCQNVSYAHDAYTLVPVPIPNTVLSLYDCIDQFIKPEIVEGVMCDKCKVRCNAMKQLSFWTLPQVLIVQLKRFDHHLRKIDRFVQAPLKLNMTQYVTHPRVAEKIRENPDALQMYDLRGVVCHSGQLNGGHYTAKCWRPDQVKNEGGRWIFCNDASVRPMAEAELQSPQNYIFFYEMTAKTKEFWPR